MGDDDSPSWQNATWEGNRRAQLRASLKLSPRQRFEALEELAETSEWLGRAGGSHRYPDELPRERTAAPDPTVQEQAGRYGGHGEAPPDREPD